MADRAVLSIRFNIELSKIVAEKAQNTQIFTKESYFDIINKVKAAKAKVTNKMPEDYQRLKRFDIMSIAGVEKLIVPVDSNNVVRLYVHTEEIFSILHNVHIALKHGGRERMARDIALRYKNITREMIMIYLNICPTCNQARYKLTQRLIESYQSTTSEKLVQDSDMLLKFNNSSCHVCIIDIKSQVDVPYKHVLVYQEYITKFIQLRALQSTMAQEIADNLLDIFGIFGPPTVIQTDIEKTDFDKIMKILRTLWPELNNTQGIQCLPDTTSSRLMKEIRTIGHASLRAMINRWLTQNSCNKWDNELGCIQLKINRTYDSGIDCTPYEAMFGVEFKNDRLKTSSILSVPNEDEHKKPKEAVHDVKSKNTEVDTMEGDTVLIADQMKQETEKSKVMPQAVHSVDALPTTAEAQEESTFAVKQETPEDESPIPGTSNTTAYLYVDIDKLNEELRKRVFGNSLDTVVDETREPLVKKEELDETIMYTEEAESEEPVVKEEYDDITIDDEPLVKFARKI